MRTSQQPPFSPTATAWASAFHLTLKQAGWYEHPTFSSRVPHASEFVSSQQHVFGSAKLDGQK